MSDPSGAIRIVIRYMVNFRERTGKKQEELTLAAGATVRDVLQQLNDRYDLALPDGSTMIVVNGKGWSQLPKGLEQELDNGDRLSLFPPLMGG
ncbi:MAG: MoaD/ThiS family protein [Spirochaetaceae bacterium]|nr:MAG: MoaD/ThiS family protein [Spirochaetaceae bacterium]